MPDRDIEAQRKAGAIRDAAHQEQQKKRDQAAAARLKDLQKAGVPVMAKDSFSYYSQEEGALRAVPKGDVYDPRDEPVVHNPLGFKTALLQGVS